MMFCPFCVEGKTMVIDSSWDDQHKTIKRRRLCLSCSYKWTTLEIDQDQVEFLDDSFKKNKPQFPPQDDENDMGQPTEEGG